MNVTYVWVIDNGNKQLIDWRQLFDVSFLFKKISLFLILTFVDNSLLGGFTNDMNKKSKFVLLVFIIFIRLDQNDNQMVRCSGL